MNEVEEKNQDSLGFGSFTLLRLEKTCQALKCPARGHGRVSLWEACNAFMHYARLWMERFSLCGLQRMKALHSIEFGTFGRFGKLR